MRNKKLYISPAVKVVFMETSQPIAASGYDDPWGQHGDAKGHNSFWDDWNEEDEEEKPMFQQPKSLWD